MDNKSKIVRLYIRVSTNLQVKDGVSIETQKKRLEDYCRYNNYSIAKTYIDEGLSGKSINRPALLEMINELQKEDIVLVYSLSRFSRNTKDALSLIEEINKKGAYFQCLDPQIDLASPIGRCLFTILMSFNQLERENTSKLISDNMKRLSAENKLRPKPPFGYRFIAKDKDYEPYEPELAIVRKIKQLHEEGMRTYHICKEIIKIDNSKKWQATQIQRIIDTDYDEIKNKIVSHHKS